MIDLLQSTISDQEFQPVLGMNQTMRWYMPDVGVLILEPKQATTKSVVLSAGIHGNETAPVEILNELNQLLFAGELTLSVRLMLILGNPAALKSGSRYQEIDLNRLFSGRYQQYASSVETARAARLELLMQEFFTADPRHDRIHYDLHTAIKASHYQRFGLLPFREDGSYDQQMLQWLDQAGMEALVVNHAPSATFSYFSSQFCQANSCTLELGKAKPFGQNDLSQFDLIRAGLISLISAGELTHQNTEHPKIFRVTQELTKKSDDFTLAFDDQVKNFTPFEKGTVLATDGDHIYRVNEAKEWVIFPNSGVRIGLRAGLMLTEVDAQSLFHS